MKFLNLNCRLECLFSYRSLIVQHSHLRAQSKIAILIDGYIHDSTILLFHRRRADVYFNLEARREKKFFLINNERNLSTHLVVSNLEMRSSRTEEKAKKNKTCTKRNYAFPKQVNESIIWSIISVLGFNTREGQELGIWTLATNINIKISFKDLDQF